MTMSKPYVHPGFDTPGIGQLSPRPLMPWQDNSAQEQQQMQSQGQSANQIGKYLGGMGGGSTAVTPAMAAGAGPGATSMYSTGVAGAMPASLGGGTIAGPMSVSGMSTAAPAAAGGAGGMGALGAVAWPAAIIGAIGAAGHYQEKQGINTWGEHLTDFGGSHIRHGEELDRLSGKWLGDNYLGDTVGKALEAPMKISSLRPKAMLEGLGATLDPLNIRSFF